MAAGQHSAIAWEGLTKEFSGRRLWEPFEGDLPQGSSTVVLGPSGVGKTTFLRIIAGLEEVHEGRIFIFGQDMTNSSPAARNVSFLFQKAVLYPFLSVRDNIAFPLTIQGASKRSVDDRVERLAWLLEIGSLLDRSPGTLSGGEWQRAALARCFARDSVIRLLDEPVKAALEPNLRKKLREIIRGLHKEFGGTSIVVTHDQDEGLELGENALIMLRGKEPVLQSIETAYSSPRNRDIALFLGGGVPIAANYDEESRSLTTPGGTRLSLRNAEVGERKEGREWVVRPEAVRLGHGKGAFEIKEIFFQGATQRLFLLGPEGIVLEAIEDSASARKKGDQVAVRLENRLVPCFDDRGRLLDLVTGRD